MKEERLKRNLVIEKALPEVKKKKSPIPKILLFLLICAAIFCILEKLGYIDYLDFI